jgi:hypothetical protein
MADARLAVERGAVERDALTPDPDLEFSEVFSEASQDVSTSIDDCHAIN